MLLKLIAVGRIKDRNLAALCAEMLGRLRFDAKIDVQEIKDGGRESENRRILEMLAARIGRTSCVFRQGRITAVRSSSGAG